ncbi:translesion error-prone DNA polymerase V autoproteolytic subunit [Comamonas sp. w2-DMI]|uniref:LexA family protein n=1 Tax=Comamonas sp. w2-DMI TaxID=3126391 RepID=UPI0032E3C280
MQPIQLAMSPCWVLSCDGTLRAGFPSPAEDHACAALNLTKRLVRNELSTYYFRVAGDSMRDAGIYDGSCVLVDRAEQPVHGRVVVASVNQSDFTLKFLYRKNGQVRLEAANPAYLPIIPKEGTTISIWGVASHTILALPGFSI